MHTSPGTASEPTTGAADLLLVQRALAGQGPAIEAVLTRLSCTVRFVFRLNRRLGYRLPTECLEDVIQQVYAAVWSRLRDFAGAAALESWVFGFCRNCLRAEARRRASGLRLVPPTGDDSVLDRPVEQLEPDAAASRVEGIEALRDELARLKPVERRVVELRHLDGWSFEAIARDLGLPASTVKDRCYRALVKMKARLRRRDVSS